MGRRHLRVVNGLEGVEVAAVVEPDAAHRKEAAAASPSAVPYASLADALNAETLDFACIATPVPSLPLAAHEALAAGLHVLLEKPMAPTEQQAQALAEAAEERGVLLAVGHVERCNPAVIALKRRLDEGLVGRVVQMHARRLSPFPHRAGMTGVALDLATHDIDVIRFLAEGEVERVYAETVSGLGAGSEDLLCATLRFEASMTGVLESNWVTPTKVRQLSVTGERGMCIVDYLTQDLTFYEHPTRPTRWEPLAGMRGGGEGDMVRYALERREPLVVQWEGFLQAIRGGGPPPVTAQDGIAALSVARAIQRAGETHEVTVPSYRQAALA